MTDIDTIRERHYECSPDACLSRGPDAAGNRWPCETRVVLDALDRQADLSGEALTGMGREAAHAKALAEALDNYRHGDDCYCPHGWGDPMTPEHTTYCHQSRAALAAYDKDHER